MDIPDILRYYNSIIRGYLNYYTFADNRASLGTVVHGLKHSCALTLRSKLKLPSRAAVFKKYGKSLTYTEVKRDEKGVMSEKKTGLYIPETFRRLSFDKRFVIKEVNLPNLYRVWNSKMTSSNLWKTCIICGSIPVEMHHLRKIRSLKNNSNLDFFKTQMAAINRKQVPLCIKHHQKVHGKLGGLTDLERELFKIGCSKFINRKDE